MKNRLLLLFLLTALLPTLLYANPVINKPDGESKGKIVFIASDHEYRSEETCPALARILTKHHGFTTVVCFGVDKNGEIEAGASHVPGLEHLKDADGCVMFTRFQDLPDEQMVHIDDYLNRAGPIVGLRTSTHGFRIGKGKKYEKYDFRYAGDDYKNGFGEQVLGQTWVGHYGRNHEQSTRIDIIPEKAKHPILRGVKNIHVQCGGYNAEPNGDWDILTMAQPLMSMMADGKADSSKPPKASEWTRLYTGKDGQKGRVFTSLYGASEDILNPGYRRMIINGIYWTLGLEDEIEADSDIAFVGPYEPNNFRIRGYARGVKPSAYDGYSSRIPLNADTGNAPIPQPKKKKQPKQSTNQPVPKKNVTAKGPVKNVRYVRIDLPGGTKTPLTLAEVEVMSGGKNIAPAGKATQISMIASGAPERAIDGKKDPEYTKKGQTHTDYGKNLWWELDLGKKATIDQVEIWNRGEGFESRLDGFQLSLLDDKRKPLFSKIDNRAPDGSVRFDFAKGSKLSYQDHSGKPNKPLPKGAAPATKKPSGKKNSKSSGPADPLAEVPADLKDPSEFAFQKNDVVAILGNGLADRMQHDGWMETLLQAGTKGLDLRFRNMSLSGDRVDQFPRSQGFTHMVDYLRHVEPTVVFCMFGYNESFENDTSNYQQRLGELVKMIRGTKPGGQFPRIVLFSPIAHENINHPSLPDGKENNERLAQYAVSTQKAAEANGVAYVDLYHPTQKAYRDNELPLTINGVHLNELGNQKLAEIIATDLLAQEIAADTSHESLRRAVLDKNYHWHKRYRRVDGNDIWGSRARLAFVDGQTNATVLQHELSMLDMMTANRDPKIWAIANGSDHQVDDSNVLKPIPVKTNVGGGSRFSNAMKEGNLTYQDGREALKDLTVPDDFEIQLFADEKKFPGLGNPVQMEVDTRGRLWVATWPTYPMWEPMKEQEDALLILTDEDGDGEADKATEFAKVHNPLGFTFWNGGVIVASQPDILFLRDNDGDDVADERYVLLQGIGSSDTHHAANNFTFGPDGGIYWQSGIFLQNNHEHPWGASLITQDSGMYRFDPRRYTIAFHAPNRPNPHGIAFDRWGYLYATDGTSGKAYQVRPDGDGFNMYPLLKKEVRPVPASEIISSANFPDEMQQNYIICNTIGFLGVKHYDLHRDGHDKHKPGEVWGTPAQDLLVSQDKNFRPTDAVFGADGALYVSDWQNVIIGHMQHNIRDPKRDHLHGRIYRIHYTKKPLQEPVAIDGEPLDKLMANLQHPIDGVRQRTRVEISERPTDDVIAACNKWLASLDPENADHQHHFLEGLWVHQQHDTRNPELLEQLLNSSDTHVANAAKVVNHHWTVADPVNQDGGSSPESDHEAELQPGGIISQTDSLTHVRIVTVVEKMSYDFKRFEVKAGTKVKVDFVNPDFMPHNIVFCAGKSGDEVAAAAIAMGADGFKKQFIPDSDQIIARSSMLDNGGEETFEFTAPQEKGEHDIVCTFPGHATVMRGVLVVK